eukprot:TRINITY_DN28053_c0_g5_i1.p1 TRINITY_DN28053_c0_g5~~TRINITY_DN28053_c0_g5_i1.p1  ORF type:complete len:574 (+),score=77.45 TRINITY_DN28053_c0_g5_i1:104-1723(+)
MDVAFRDGLAGRLAEVENYARAEVDRLESLLASLREESGRVSATLDGAGSKVGALVDEPQKAGSSKVEPDPDSPVSCRRSPEPVRAGMSVKALHLNVDAQAVKAEMKQASQRPVRKIADFYHEKGCFQYIAKSNWFEYLTLAIICCNAVWLWIDLDYNGASSLIEAKIIFQIAEHFFCTFFTVELFIRFMAYRHKIDSLKDCWFLFDLVLVLMIIIETWIMTIVLSLTEGNGVGGLGNASVLRCLRLLRLTRIAKLMRLLPELMTMVKGMAAGIRSVLVTSVLFGAITYFFAIVFKSLTTGTTVGEQYFGSVPEGAFTLVVEGMLPDNGALLTTLGSEKWYLGVLFFLFVSLASITIMNMLIGVLCDVLSTVSADEKERIELSLMETNLRRYLNIVDEDHNCNLSKTEFEAMFANEQARSALQRGGVDVCALADDADIIFDGREHSEVSFEEFMELTMQFRTNNASIIRSVSSLRRLTRSALFQLGEKVALIDERMNLLLQSARFDTSGQGLKKAVESSALSTEAGSLGVLGATPGLHL